MHKYEQLARKRAVELAAKWILNCIDGDSGQCQAVLDELAWIDTTQRTALASNHRHDTAMVALIMNELSGTPDARRTFVDALAARI